VVCGCGGDLDTITSVRRVLIVAVAITAAKVCTARTALGAGRRDRAGGGRGGGGGGAGSGGGGGRGGGRGGVRELAREDDLGCR
jgi:hypothetical protein